jgi:hypothetical protein
VTKPSGYERDPLDYYVEPAWAVDGLFNVERFIGGIWDPACGSGTIPGVARRRGMIATGSDIADRGAGLVADFLKIRCPEGRKPLNIVTNPPFKLAVPFIEHALELAEYKVAALMPIGFLESAKRLPFFRSTPLARVWVSVSRVSMPPGGQGIKPKGGTECFAWFVWSKDWSGPPTLGHFEKPKEVKDVRAA